MNLKYLVPFMILSILILIGLTFLEIKNPENKDNNSNKNLKGPEPDDTKNPDSSFNSDSNTNANIAQPTKENTIPKSLEEIVLINIAQCQLNQGLVHYVFSNGEVSCATISDPEGESLASQGYTTLISSEIKTIITCITNNLNANIQPNNIICE